MTPRGKFVAVLSLVWFVLGTSYYSHRWTLLQFVTAPLFFGVLTVIVLSFVWIFMDWHRVGWLSLLPFFISVLSLVGSFALALRIREQIFEWSLPSYEAVVQQMQSGRILVMTNEYPRSIPEAVPQARMAHSVAACRNTNGVLTVEIITEGGFPVSHSGYLFSSSGAIVPGSAADKFYRARRQVRPQWFYITY
jgi:hypothetical protein